MCPCQGHRAAPVGRALEFEPVARARPRVRIALQLVEPELQFSLALETAMFERPAVVMTPLGQVSISPREQSVLLRPKVAESVSL